MERRDLVGRIGLSAWLTRSGCVAVLLTGPGVLPVHAQPDRALVEIDRLHQLRASDQLDSLESLAKRILTGSTPTAGSLRYEAEWHLAFVREIHDDPLGATEHAQRALLIAREERDTARMLGSLYQLTKFNVEGRHYEEADRHRHEHLALARAYGKDTIQLALALNSMGSMFSRLEHPDSEVYYYRAGIRVLAGRNHAVKQALLGNLASALSAQGDHDEAALLLQQVVAGLDSTDLRNRAWALNNLGQSLMHAQRYKEALNVLNVSDSLNNESGGALDLAIELAEVRADILEAMGDHAGAFTLIKQARDLQDTLFVRSMNEQLLELETKFGTQLKEEEIQRLDAQTRAQQERLRLRNIQLYGSIALAVLLLGAVLLVWNSLRQKRKHTKVLEKLNVELKEQKDRIEEINRLLQLKVLRTQMNPHFIYNSLNAIHNLVRKGESVAASAYLDGFARLLRMVLDHSVKDRILLSGEMAFLRQYLKLEAMRFEDGLHYTVDAEPGLLNGDDDLLVPTLLVQPFVENAVWHGLAAKEGEKKLSVRFAERDGKVVCTVEDNGVGRDAAPKRAHPDGSASLGLQLTNERLQLLAFKLEGTGRVLFTDLKEDDRPTGTRVELILSEA
ncbi:MAG: histidine kinase [Flavobacteriales bacterium]|nr:histidine kinase [Flavobacteriales bacterium]